MNWYKKSQIDSGYQTQPTDSIQNNPQINIPTQLKKKKKRKFNQYKKAQYNENKNNENTPIEEEYEELPDINYNPHNKQVLEELGWIEKEVIHKNDLNDFIYNDSPILKLESHPYNIDNSEYYDYYVLFTNGELKFALLGNISSTKNPQIIKKVMERLQDPEDSNYCVNCGELNPSRHYEDYGMVNECCQTSSPIEDKIGRELKE
jgi:hypothetical protein